jgi:hypothetical protein
MSPQLAALLLAGLALVGFMGWSSAQERKRVVALKAWVRGKGRRFVADRRESPDWRWDLFHKGHSRFAQALAIVDLPGATPGLDGASVMVFEYHYAISAGVGRDRRTQHYWHTCAVLDLAFDPGNVSFMAEGVGDKLAALLGVDDIDFEDAEFSRRFKVQADEKKHAWDLLDGALMTWLKAHPGVQFESRGRQALLVLESTGKATPRRFEQLVDWSRGFLAQVPRVLVNAERSRLSQPPVVEAGNAAATSRAARN